MSKVIDEKIRPVWAEVHINRLRENVDRIKEKVQGKMIIAIVKADAYGHGACQVARAIESRVDCFGVAIMEEAVALKESGIEKPIMVLSYAPRAYFREALEGNFILNALSYAYAKDLDEEAGRQGKKAQVFIALDTGMERLGFSPDDAGVAEILKMKDLKNLSFHSMYTHFARADEKDKAFTKIQLQRYTMVMNTLKENGMVFANYHAANSAGVIDHKEAYFDMVRPGIILYGYYPSEDVNQEDLDLEPILTLKGRIIQLKKVKKGSGISYGHKYTTTREETLIATIPIGYADGYSRGLSGKAWVIVGDKLCPQVGNICMDHMMVDVTEVEGVQVFDEVILMGKKGNLAFTADHMAKILRTINYEVLCALSPRIPRIYVDSEEY